MSRPSISNVARTAIFFFVVALMAVSCSTSTEVRGEVAPAAATSEESSTQAEAVEEANPTNDTDSSAVATDDASQPSDPEPADTATSAAPETPAIPEIADEPGLQLADGVVMEQLTARSGGGTSPMLAWTPVAAADSYSVVVYDAQDAPWWAWAGPETEIIIGGVETEANIGGPQAATGVRWSVFAFDAEGNLVGASPNRSLEP